LTGSRRRSWTSKLKSTADDAGTIRTCAIDPSGSSANVT
jgi:hypothetical protein